MCLFFRTDGEGTPERDHGMVNGEKDGAAEGSGEGKSVVVNSR